jgi:hypothetical protein
MWWKRWRDKNKLNSLEAPFIKALISFSRKKLS